jgi:hypothetical protein
VADAPRPAPSAPSASEAHADHRRWIAQVHGQVRERAEELLVQARALPPGYPDRARALAHALDAARYGHTYMLTLALDALAEAQWWERGAGHSERVGHAPLDGESR